REPRSRSVSIKLDTIRLLDGYPGSSTVLAPTSSHKSVKVVAAGRSMMIADCRLPRPSRGHRKHEDTPQADMAGGRPGAGAGRPRLPGLDARDAASLGPLPRTSAAVLPGIAAVSADARAVAHGRERRHPSGRGRSRGAACRGARRGAPLIIACASLRANP